MSAPRPNVDDRIGSSAGAPVVQSIDLPNRVQIEFVERGDPAGVPVLLLHGFTDSWRSFEPVLPFLPASIRAFALSQRGHGDADRPAAGYGPRDFAADLDAFAGALDLRRVVVVGHSLSALIALRFALDHPARTLGLVLVGWRGYPRPSTVAALASLADPIDPDFVREFQAASLARPVPPTFFEAMVRESLKVPARVWRAVIEDVQADDFSAELGRIAAPTLIAWGDRDATCPRSEQDALAATIPRARLTVFPDVGHCPHWEDPARFAAELTDFVRRIAATSG